MLRKAPPGAAGVHVISQSRIQGEAEADLTTPLSYPLRQESERPLEGAQAKLICVGMAAPTGLAAAAVACPAYPWPHDGAQRGQKVFMQSDCAACHTMLPHAALREAARGGAGQATAAEIVVMEEAPPPPTARPLHGGACQPDLTRITQEVLRYDLYADGGAMAAPRVLADGAAACQELKKKVALASPAWLQLLQPYTRTSQAA